MKEYKNILLILLFIAVLLIIYVYYPKSEPTISFSDFKDELNKSEDISIVTDTRLSPATGFVINCGLDLVTRIHGMGKNARYFSYESEDCLYSSISNTTLKNSSINECESLMSSSVVFYIKYNPTKNSTIFYKSKVVTEGDNDFLADCQISRLIS